jgi:hypothetical protein
MRSVFAIAALVLTALPAGAVVIPWSASLAPENEVPPVMNSTASGAADGTIDTISGLLTWEITWSGLTGDATALHFHGPATSTQNADVVVNIGLISGLPSPSIGDTVISSPQVAELLSGLWYINVHTLANSGGEIRGQVIPFSVPVPATLPLLATAVGLLAWARVRRRA